jgi:hypothetical protein
MFEGAFLKLARANHHIADLQRSFTTFLQAHPYTFLVEHIPGSGEAGLVIDFKLYEPRPDVWSLSLADAIHNLRTALDHATWELIGLDGGTQDKSISFVTSKNQQDYEASCKGIKTPREDTKKFFVNLATYEGGAGEPLYGLHLLDNDEKHRVITPLIGLAKISHIEIVGPGDRKIVMRDFALGMHQNPESQVYSFCLEPRLRSTITHNRPSRYSLTIPNSSI